MTTGENPLRNYSLHNYSLQNSHLHPPLSSTHFVTVHSITLTPYRDHTAEMDSNSVSSLGGDNIYHSDHITPPRSPTVTAGHKRVEAVSNMLLQEAFSSLSLADKCALSVSLGTHSQALRRNSSGSTTEDTDNGQRASSPPPGVLAALEEEERLSGLRSISREFTKSLSSSDCSGGDAYLTPIKFLKSKSLSLAGDYLDSMSMRSVISESDKESLDVAMSMMGQQELEQVEDEVRRIQNNVRGWLLRKNYVNLRDAAKTLQVAWRGKRRQSPRVIGGDGQGLGFKGSAPMEGVTHSAHSSVSLSSSSSALGRMHIVSLLSDDSPLSTPDDSSETAEGEEGEGGEGEGGLSETPRAVEVPELSSRQTPLPHSLSSSSLTVSLLPLASAVNRSDSEAPTISSESRKRHAAATLQAATRAMIARRVTFTNAKRQAMASLVIQKSFLLWFHKDQSTALSIGAVQGRKRKDCK